MALDSCSRRSPGHERWKFARRVSLHVKTDPVGLGHRPPLVLEGVSKAKSEDEDYEADAAREELSPGIRIQRKVCM